MYGIPLSLCNLIVNAVSISLLAFRVRKCYSAHNNDLLGLSSSLKFDHSLRVGLVAMASRRVFGYGARRSDSVTAEHLLQLKSARESSAELSAEGAIPTATDAKLSSAERVSKYDPVYKPTIVNEPTWTADDFAHLTDVPADTAERGLWGLRQHRHAGRFMRADARGQICELRVEMALARCMAVLLSRNYAIVEHLLADVKPWVDELGYAPLQDRLEFYRGIARLGMGDLDTAQACFDQVDVCRGRYKEFNMVEYWLFRLERRRKASGEQRTSHLAPGPGPAGGGSRRSSGVHFSGDTPTQRTGPLGGGYGADDYDYGLPTGRSTGSLGDELAAAGQEGSIDAYGNSQDT